MRSLACALCWLPLACGRFGFDAIAVDAGEPREAGKGLSTIDFQDGRYPTPAYAGTRDTTLNEDTPTSNTGLEERCSADGFEDATGGGDQVALLSWDTSAVPPGSQVQSGSITFTRDGTHEQYEITELVRPWLEIEATWAQSSTGAAWEGPGAAGPGDNGGVVLAVIPEDRAPTQATLSISLNDDGVAAIQRWIDDPSTNHGLRIADPDSVDGLDFFSREEVAVSSRPRLTIVYQAR